LDSPESSSGQAGEEPGRDAKAEGPDHFAKHLTKPSSRPENRPQWNEEGMYQKIYAILTSSTSGRPAERIEAFDTKALFYLAK